MEIEQSAPVPQSFRKRGRPRSEITANLPPGLVARTRKGVTRYSLIEKSNRGKRRTEIPLGKSLDNALAEYQAIVSRPKPIKHSSVAIRPWIAKELFKTCRSHANRRKIQFDLTLADVEKLLADSGNRCALTGIHFETRKPEGARFRHWMPSIDRIQCSGHYEVKNVRLVCMAVNIALSDLGEETLIHIARALLRKRRSFL